MKEKVTKLFSTVKAMWDKPLEGRFLNLKEILSFGMYSLGNSWIYNTIMLVITITYIPYFYGIDAIHGYTIYIGGSLINMFLVPLIGQAMEKKRTKWGRYKPYILFSLPLLALFTMMSMWAPQYDSEVDRIIYAYCSCVPVIAISTFANNMYQTMPNVITPNTQERADIMTPIGLIVGFAPTIMNIIVGPIRSAFMGQEYIAMRIIGAIAVVIGSICVMFILKVKERVYELDDKNRELIEAQEAAARAESGEGGVAGEIAESETSPAEVKAAEAETARADTEKLSFAESMKLLFKNKPLWILFAALVIGSLREFWMQFQPLAIQLRFAATTTEALNISGIPNTIIGFGVTVSMLLLPFCTRKLNKNWIIIIFSCLSLLSTAILLFFLARVNPTYLLIPVMLGDLADYQQYKTGRRLEGHIQNFIMVIPVLMSFVFMLCGWAWQQEIGFEPSKYTDIEVVPQALQDIATEWFTAAFLLSAASILGMIIILMFYPLSKKKVEEVTAALRGASVNADEMGEGDLNFMAEMRGESDAVEIVDGDESHNGEDASADDLGAADAPESASDGGGTADGAEEKEE